jgi:ribosomal protein L37AE/L43A
MSQNRARLADLIRRYAQAECDDCRRRKLFGIDESTWDCRLTKSRCRFMENMEAAAQIVESGHKSLSRDRTGPKTSRAGEPTRPVFFQE